MPDGKRERASDYDYGEIVSRLKRELFEISQQILEREEIIYQFACALLTRNHQLMLGRTGIAKSLLATKMFSIFERSGAKVFYIKASAEDTKDNYFGPIDVPIYRSEGRKVRRTQASMLDSDFAFVDEIFDTNEQILRDLMLILSERKLQEGPELYKARLHSAIAACNYMKLNEVTEAVIDRFIYRTVIPHETGVITQFRIDRSYEKMEASRFSQMHGANPIKVEEIKFVSDAALGSNPSVKIEVPSDILFIKNIILHYYIDAMKKRIGRDFYISPRRQAKLVDLLRALALLDGRLVVSEENLYGMYLGICTLNSENDEADTFKKSARETIQMLNSDAELRNQITFLTGVMNALEHLSVNPNQPINLEMLGIPKERKAWYKTFLNWLNHKPEQELTMELIVKKIEEIKPKAAFISDLRIVCLDEIKSLKSFKPGSSGVKNQTNA